MIVIIVIPIIVHDLIGGEILTATLAWASHATRNPGILIVVQIADVIAVDRLTPSMGFSLLAVSLAASSRH